MDKAGLINLLQAKKSLLCVGLDSDMQKMPAGIEKSPEGVLEFNRRIVAATAPFAVAYKINTAFYEAMGRRGWEILEETRRVIPEGIFTIADAKRGDIGNTGEQYARAFFEAMNFDSITVNPYMGEDSVRPFLGYPDKWAIVLGITSNAGSTDIQQLAVEGKPLYERVMEKVASWGSPDNLMFVTGATQTGKLKHLRAKFPENCFLVPGVGAQGGDLRTVCAEALTASGPLLINASRSIIYASQLEDFAEAARQEAEKLSLDMSLIFELISNVT